MKVERHIFVSEETLTRIIEAARMGAPSCNDDHLSTEEIEYFLGISDSTTGRSLFEIDEHADTCKFCNENIKRVLETLEHSIFTSELSAYKKSQDHLSQQPNASRPSQEGIDNNITCATTDASSSSERDAKAQNKSSRRRILLGYGRDRSPAEKYLAYKNSANWQNFSDKERVTVPSRKIIVFRLARGPPVKG